MDSTKRYLDMEELKNAIKSTKYFNQDGTTIEWKRMLDVGFSLEYILSIMKTFEPDFYGEEKFKFAIENAEYFRQKGISLAGKRILDVGFGLGYNSSMMAALEADIFGVEPDDVYFNFAVSKNLINREKAFKSTLERIPEGLLGTFDIATVFLFEVMRDLGGNPESFFDKLPKTIKPKGSVIIGIHDEYFIKDSKWNLSILPILNKHFNFVDLPRYKEGNLGNLYYILAGGPKIIDKRYYQ